MHACVCVCVRVHVYVCMCVCVCVKELIITLLQFFVTVLIISIIKGDNCHSVCGELTSNIPVSSPPLLW